MDPQRDMKEYATALSHLSRIHIHKELLNLFPFITCMVHIFAFNRGLMERNNAYTAVIKSVLGSGVYSKLLQSIDKHIQTAFIKKTAKMRSYIYENTDHKDSKAVQEECYRVLNVYDAFLHGGGNKITVALPLLQRTRQLIKRHIPLPKYINKHDLLSLLFSTSRWTFLLSDETLSKSEMLDGFMSKDILGLLTTAGKEIYEPLLKQKYNPHQCLSKFEIVGYSINFRTKEAYYCRNDLSIALLLLLQLPHKTIKSYIKYSSVIKSINMIVMEGNLDSYELTSAESKKHRTEQVLFIYALLSITAIMLC